MSGSPASPRVARTAGRAMCASGMAMLLALGAAAPASASDFLGSAGGLEYWSQATPPTAPGSEGIGDASCDQGTRPTGGGMRLPGDPAEAYIFNLHRETFPTGFAGWFQNVSEPNAVGTAYAICTDRRVKDRAAGVGTFGSIPPGKSRTRTARCPKGTHASGGGGWTGAHDVGEILVSSHPVDGGDQGKVPDDGWRARVYNPHPSEKGAVLAQVLCVKAMPRYRTGFDFAECPGATHVSGGGIRHPKSAAASTWINSSFPGDSLGSDPDTTPDDLWFAGGKDELTPATVYAVCL